LSRPRRRSASRRRAENEWSRAGPRRGSLSFRAAGSRFGLRLDGDLLEERRRLAAGGGEVGQAEAGFVVGGRRDAERAGLGDEARYRVGERSGSFRIAEQGRHDDGGAHAVFLAQVVRLALRLLRLLLDEALEDAGVLDGE